MTPDRIESLRVFYRDGLLHDTLPFWLKHSVDREFGGFMTSLDQDGTVIDSDKGVWQQGRFVWLLGELYNRCAARDEWIQLAISGADFIEKHCVDPIDGRMWFHVTRDGRPIRKRRYAFSESFAAIAFGELFQATGDRKYADRAQRFFKSFVDQNCIPQDAPTKYTGTRPMKGLAFPMITIVTAQELRDSIGLPNADRWIQRSIDTILKDHLKPDLECVMESVGINGEVVDHADGRTLNPGHAMEGAWFIMREGQLRRDDSLVQMGLRMLDWSWQRGWDQEHGGIFSLVDVKGLPVQEYWHDMKFWWPHNEAIIATLMAYQLSRNEKYAAWHQQVHNWAFSHFPDTNHGEWFGYLHHDGSISSRAKGNMWKGPFHLPRMQYTCWQILEQMAVSETTNQTGDVQPDR